MLCGSEHSCCVIFMDQSVKLSGNDQSSIIERRQIVIKQYLNKPEHEEVVLLFTRLGNEDEKHFTKRHESPDIQMGGKIAFA